MHTFPHCNLFHRLGLCNKTFFAFLCGFGEDYPAVPYCKQVPDMTCLCFCNFSHTLFEVMNNEERRGIIVWILLC